MDGCKQCQNLQTEVTESSITWPYWCDKHERPVVLFKGKCYAEMEESDDERCD